MKGPYDLSMMIGNQHLKNYANIDKSVTIHHRDLQVLATELYKVHHGLAAELMQKFNIETRNVKSVFKNVKCSKIIPFLGLKIWELLPSNIKDSEILNIFKSNIKSSKSENCP